MADQIRDIYRKVRARSFDARALLRLAMWGCAASAALMIAVLSAYPTREPQSARVTIAAPTNTGNIERLSPPAPAIMPGLAPRPQETALVTAPATAPTPTVVAEMAARTANVEKDTHQLSEAVHALAADRDRLIERIASIERGLEDLTGTLKRQAAAPTAPPPLPAIASRSSETPVAPALTPPPREPDPAPAEAVAPETVAPPLPPVPSPATRVAVSSITDTTAARVGDYGVDVGGAVNFDGLRALWNATRRIKVMAHDRLHPLVAVRENKARGIDLRLIIGPLPSTQAATQMCAELLAARRSCQMTTFEGQPLPLVAPEPERRPSVATPTRPTPPTQPAQARAQPARP
jgi:hypothetical protein